MQPRKSLPSKSKIFEYWKERLAELGFFIDWGEPGCWVCGYHYDDKYDVKNPQADWNETLKAWNAIPLQRCHIVPRSLGGTNNPDNIFLMCKECHDLAPNTAIPKIFLEWARNQNWHKRDAAKILAACALYNLDSEDQASIFELMSSSEFVKWSKDKLGSHLPQSGYASITSRITPASLVGLAIEYQKSFKDQS